MEVTRHSRAAIARQLFFSLSSNGSSLGILKWARLAIVVSTLALAALLLPSLVRAATPELVADRFTNITAIAVNGSRVYVGTVGGQLYRMPKSANALHLPDPAIENIAAVPGFIDAIAFHGGNIYFDGNPSSFGGGSIYRMPEDLSSGPTVVVSGVVKLLAIVAPDLYYWDGDNSLKKVSLSGGSPVELLPPPLNLGQFTFDASAFYFDYCGPTGDGVCRLALTTNTVSTIIPGGSQSGGAVFVDANNVYTGTSQFINTAGSFVLQAPKLGGGPVTTLLTSAVAFTFFPLLSDGASVYYGEGVDRFNASLKSIPVGGGAPTTLADGVSIRFMVNDAGTFYWSTVSEAPETTAVYRFGVAVPPPLATLSIADSAPQTEGNTGTKAFEFTVSLSLPSALTVTVNYATADGTANAGSDYVVTSGTLTFTPGETTKTVTVTVNGDTSIESDETFYVNLASPANAAIGNFQGVGTIVNDDAPPLPRLATSETLPFDSQVIGTTSASRTLSVSNVGDAPLVINSLGLFGSGFQVISDSCTGTTLLPDSVCDVDTVFTPTAEGLHSSVLEIVSNDPGSPSLVQLSGVGVTAKSAVTITSITPTIGHTDTLVVLRGKNFGKDVGVIKFDETPTIITAWKQNEVEVLAPGGLTGTAYIRATSAEGVASNAVPFTYARPGERVWRHLKGPWKKDCEGTFGSIAIHPSNPKLIYIGSGAFIGCGIFASANAGSKWSALNDGLPKTGVPRHYDAIARIVIAPSDPRVIYVGTFVDDTVSRGRVYRTTDGGFTWVEASGPPSPFQPQIHAPVLDIDVHPLNPNVAFVALAGHGVYRTANAGSSWVKVLPGLINASSIDYHTAVRIAPSSPHTVFVAGLTTFSGSVFPCSLRLGKCVPINGVLPLPLKRSDDSGETWSNIPNPTPTTFTTVAALITDITINPVDPDLVHVATMAYQTPLFVSSGNKGIFQSIDGGEHWAPTSGELAVEAAKFPIFRLVRAPAATTLFALSTKDGALFTSTNDGVTWNRVSVLGLVDPTAIFGVAVGGSNIYVTTSRGVYVLAED